MDYTAMPEGSIGRTNINNKKSKKNKKINFKLFDPYKFF